MNPLKTTKNTPVLVALGANLPSGGARPAETVLAAFKALSKAGLDVVVTSRLWRTPCFPPGAGPDYVNAAAVIAAPGLTPQEILVRLHGIEAEFGRERLGRWAGRTLDLDLIAVGELVLPDAPEQTRWRDLAPGAQARLAPDRLILPHPRLQDRDFVLIPLAEVAPDWRHPLLGLTVREMLAALPAGAGADVVSLP